MKIEFQLIYDRPLTKYDFLWEQYRKLYAASGWVIDTFCNDTLEKERLDALDKLQILLDEHYSFRYGEENVNL